MQPDGSILKTHPKTGVNTQESSRVIPVVASTPTRTLLATTTTPSSVSNNVIADRVGVLDEPLSIFGGFDDVPDITTTTTTAPIPEPEAEAEAELQPQIQPPVTSRYMTIINGTAEIAFRAGHFSLPSIPDTDTTAPTVSIPRAFGRSVKDVKWDVFATRFYEALVVINQTVTYWHNLLWNHRDVWKKVIEDRIARLANPANDSVEQHEFHRCKYSCIKLDPFKVNTGMHFCYVYWLKIMIASTYSYQQLLKYYLGGSTVKNFIKTVHMKGYKDMGNGIYVSDCYASMRADLFVELNRLKLVCSAFKLYPINEEGFMYQHHETRDVVTYAKNYGLILSQQDRRCPVITSTRLCSAIRPIATTTNNNPTAQQVITKAKKGGNTSNTAAPPLLTTLEASKNIMKAISQQDRIPMSILEELLNGVLWRLNTTWHTSMYDKYLEHLMDKVALMYLGPSDDVIFDDVLFRQKVYINNEYVNPFKNELEKLVVASTPSLCPMVGDDNSHGSQELNVPIIDGDVNAAVIEDVEEEDWSLGSPESSQQYFEEEEEEAESLDHFDLLSLHEEDDNSIRSIQLKHPINTTHITHTIVKETLSCLDDVVAKNLQAELQQTRLDNAGTTTNTHGNEARDLMVNHTFAQYASTLCYDIHLNKYYRRKYPREKWIFTGKTDAEIAFKESYFAVIKMFFKCWCRHRRVSNTDMIRDTAGDKFSGSIVTKGEYEWFEYYARVHLRDVSKLVSTSTNKLLEILRPYEKDAVLKASGLELSSGGGNSSSNADTLFDLHRVQLEYRGYADWLRLVLSGSVFSSVLPNFNTAQSQFILHTNSDSLASSDWFRIPDFPFLWFNGGKYHVYCNGTLWYANDVPSDLLASVKKRVEDTVNPLTIDFFKDESAKGNQEFAKFLTQECEKCNVNNSWDDHIYVGSTMEEMRRLLIKELFVSSSSSSSSVDDEDDGGYWDEEEDDVDTDEMNTLEGFINGSTASDHQQHCDMLTNATELKVTWMGIKKLEHVQYGIWAEPEADDGDTLYDTMALWVSIILGAGEEMTLIAQKIRDGIRESCNILLKKQDAGAQKDVPLIQMVNLVRYTLEMTDEYERQYA